MTIHQKAKLLIFPGEAENAFELFQALRYSTRFEVWGASSRRGYGNLIFRRYRDDLPDIYAPDFLPAFNRFIEENGISLIFPTHDEVALYLAEHSADIQATIVGSGVECARLCREKKALYATFAEQYFCPQTYDQPTDVTQWPVFIKPNRGQGSIGCARADDHDTLQRLWQQTTDPVLCEYLPGEEMTVDCFSDRHGQLRFVGPRSRDTVKMGIAFVSRTLALDSSVQQLAQALHDKLHPRGLWFFQVKRSAQGSLKLLEVSCRAAGSMSVYRQLGVNLPLLAVYDAIGLDVHILKNNYQVTLRRRLHSSYVTDFSFSAIYVDYDDTLIVDGQVNAILMQFLYQSRNQGKQIILLSRHSGDLLKSLQEFRIHSEIFDKIIHITDAQKKSSHITCRDSILIDNLFIEREDASIHAGIPVFDVDAIESLIQE